MAAPLHDGGHTHPAASAVDMGEKPPLSRPSQVPPDRARPHRRDDAMDISAQSICWAPATSWPAYQQLPVAITVEGANILTRSLIIFGQARSAAILTCWPRSSTANRPREAPGLRRRTLRPYPLRRLQLHSRVRIGITGSQWAHVPRCRPRPGALPEADTVLGGLCFLADVSMLVLGVG